MIALTLITLLVATLLCLLYLAIRSTKTESPANSNYPVVERSRFNNSRSDFVLSIIAGYFLAGIALMTGTVALEGIAGLSAGVFILLASPIYALPVLVIAAIVGYPVYRRCRKNSISFLIIWLAYSAAAVVSALCTALLTSVAIFQSFDTITGIAGFMGMASLVVAFPSALFTWVRQRPI